jgi:hypothetical protein
MALPDTQMIMDMVEKKTGFSVSIVVDDKITTHSGMASATSLQPMHIIKVNPKYEKYGDYLVAAQCAMLLIKWGDPNRIPDFGVVNSRAEVLIQEFSKMTRDQGVPSNAANQYAKMIVTGVLQQLNSLPMQMISMDMITNLCPGLHDLQKESVSNEIREASRSFSKKIQRATPKSIFDKNASMNAAYAIRWSQISGSKGVLLPYRSLGYINSGNKLHEIYKAVMDKSDPERYTEVVDGWARILQMEDWYAWKYRKGMQE